MTRYSRQMLLPEIGAEGQERLGAASALIVGTGGLGTPVATYLTASGVGRLVLVDFDRVDVSNLHRQPLFTEADAGRLKVDVVRERLEALNPHVSVEAHPVRLDAANALGLVRSVDVVADGTDTFATRYLVNDACVLAGVPNAFASISQFSGQASVFGGTRTTGERGPCYRCPLSRGAPGGDGALVRRGWRTGRAPGSVRNDPGHRGA